MRRIIPPLAALATALVTAGCFNPFSPVILSAQRVVSAAPSPTTAQNAVKLFQWCWVNRGVQEYRELFTDDFTFQSFETDSAGNAPRQILTRRNDEVETAQNMFIGSAERPPAEKISLDFDPNLHAFPDTRPGKEDFNLHKTIRTSVNLRVKIDSDNEVDVTGYALFYLTRGDVAKIPGDTGLKPDPLRWWIDRWDDETLSGNNLVAGRARPAAAQLVIRETMAQFKARYQTR
ncbi:MAG TPA: hypothetical protein VI504_15760 [Candidatus Eisenbacteria bacterium]|jgi:hypothetical protein